MMRSAVEPPLRLLILVVVLFVFGPQRLPAVAGAVGDGPGEFEDGFGALRSATPVRRRFLAAPVQTGPNSDTWRVDNALTGIGPRAEPVA